MDKSAVKMGESASEMDEVRSEDGQVAANLRNLLRQQAAVAGFGSFALRQSDLVTILNEAARVCAEVLSAPFCNICRYRSDENDLLIEAGYGWQEGVVGHVVSPADENSPQGRAFVTGEPSICKNLREDNDFKLPPFYAAHGIVSTIDVVIKGDERPYGVLEIASDVQHDFDLHDIEFLAGFANALAEAVATSALTSVLQTTIDRMENLVEEKDHLLEQKNVLAEELQHRVRNNLQLVYTMLSKLLSDTADRAGQRGVKSVARRVSTLAQVYDHLHGDAMTRTMDFALYCEIAVSQPGRDTRGVEQCHHADLRKRRDHPRSRHGDDAGPCRHGAGHQLLRTRISERQGIGQRVRTKRCRRMPVPRQ